MRSTLTILLILITATAYGQRAVPFGASQPTDTSTTAGYLRIGGKLRAPIYATSDTTQFFGVDQNGYMVLRAVAASNAYSKAKSDSLYAKYSDTTALITTVKRLKDTASALRTAIAAGSATGNLNISDSTTAATFPYSTIKRVNDTAAALRTTINTKGTGTVTSVATGFGLTGGTITTAGTLAVDTNTIQNRRRADSTAQAEATALNTKLNAADSTTAAAKPYVTPAYLNANFVNLSGPQTINGVKTFGNTMTAPGYMFSGGSTPKISAASGNPNGVLSNAIASLEMRTDTARLYIKTTATGNTGWVEIPNKTYTDKSDSITRAHADSLYGQALASTPTIYTADGTLTGSRTITCGGNDLNFNSNADIGFYGITGATFVIHGGGNAFNFSANDYTFMVGNSFMVDAHSAAMYFGDPNGTGNNTLVTIDDGNHKIITTTEDFELNGVDYGQLPVTIPNGTPCTDYAVVLKKGNAFHAILVEVSRVQTITIGSSPGGSDILTTTALLAGGNILTVEYFRTFVGPTTLYITLSDDNSDRTFRVITE